MVVFHLRRLVLILGPSSYLRCLGWRHSNLRRFGWSPWTVFQLDASRVEASQVEVSRIYHLVIMERARLSLGRNGVLVRTYGVSGDGGLGILGVSGVSLTL